MFKKHWVGYTAETEGIRIHEKKLIDFILDLPLPLGLGIIK